MAKDPSVFISYARKDGTELMQKLSSLLRSTGHDTWVDVKNVPAGVKWEDYIESHVRTAHVIVVLWTGAASTSPHVEKECEIARKCQKILISLVQKGTPIPDWMKQIQWIPFETLDDVIVMGKLLEGLKAVWGEVEHEIRDVRFDISERLRPLLEHVERLVSTQPRPGAAPEVLGACVELVQHFVDDAEKKPLEDIVADFFAKRYYDSNWKYYRAYQGWTQVVETIIRQGLENVRLRSVQVIYFVLVVMTRNEADELQKGEFDAATQGLGNQLKGNYQVLSKESGAAWVQRYESAPERWRPFDSGAPGRQTLEELVAQELHGLNQPGAGASAVRKAEYVPIQTLHQRPGLLTELRAKGCVVIIDALSACHPRLLIAYRRSLLDVFPTTFLIKMAPSEPVHVFDSGELVSVPFLQHHDSFFAERYREGDVHRCEKAGNEVDFRRWMLKLVGKDTPNGGGGYRQFSHGVPGT